MMGIVIYYNIYNNIYDNKYNNYHNNNILTYINIFLKY